ncbi:hypothetical protein [Nocardiopsis sp. JB363]|uniref:TPR repeat region-containing protein n=1 Tax=Nocardiopsis sp. JB363 TaxID=1434837 RepID=UPI000979E194|nr:hypothetical protein [Nocardiopsis sp. JB363]SIO85765.1 hypothetical protein BQ8420_08610 [Nocardiopsis sp. JB363]
MATIALVFYPRDFYGRSDDLYECATDLEILNARVLGRADDLGGSYDSASHQFTDLIAWNIQGHSEEDIQKWRDAAVSVSYAASVAEKWADTVKSFDDEREAQLTTWQTSKGEKEGAIPSKYQGDRITESHPQADGFLWTDWGAGDEKKCRDLYDELSTVREGLIEREQTNWNTLQDTAEDVRSMLEEGPTPENVSKLIESGNAGFGFLSLDPSRYSDLLENVELTPENAEEYAEELQAYWSGDKPLDDRYNELMLVMAMMGSNARSHQQNGTQFESEEIEFLEEFYRQLEEPYVRDGAGAGIMAYPDVMAESGMSAEEREQALGALGDGLLALSDPRIGGGYENLPQSFRYAVEGPWINPDAEGKISAGPAGLGMDMKALSAFMEHTDENLEAGYGLSTNLHLSTGAFLDAWGGEVHDSDGVLPDSEQVSHMVDVASRNKDSNYYILTGDHLNEEPGVPYGDEELRTQALEGTLTFEWHDDGHTARQLTDWLAEDVHSEDPEVSGRAGDAFTGFMETITDPDMHDALVNTGVSVTEGDNEYSDASFTQFNGGLADSLADIFDAHIYSFADSDVFDGKEPVTGIGDFDPETNFVRMGPEERAMYMQLLSGNDESAGRVANSIDIYQQIESAAYFEHGQDEEASRGSGQLQALFEEGLKRDSADRSADLDEQIERQEQITEFVVSEAGSLSEKIPVIGLGISKGMELASDDIVGAIIDGEYDVSPRHPTFTGAEFIERNYRVEGLDYLAQHSPETLNSVVRPDDIQTLVDGGAITIERDGEPVTSEDLGDDFVFDDGITIDVQKNPAEWTDNQDRALDGMDTAISNIMDDVEITTTDGRTHTGDKRVQDIVGQYENAYNDTRGYFDDQGE